MDLTKSKLLRLFLIGLGMQATAQESVVASGGDASGSFGSTSYSIGQVFYTTHFGTNGSSAQGVQQAFEVSEVLGVENFNPKNLDIVAYPNPTTSYVNVEIKNYDSELISYELYDLNGRQIDTRNIIADITKIDLDRLPSTTYYLALKQAGRQIKSFKIIKKD